MLDEAGFQPSLAGVLTTTRGMDTQTPAVRRSRAKASAPPASLADMRTQTSCLQTVSTHVLFKAAVRALRYGHPGRMFTGLGTGKPG